MSYHLSRACVRPRTARTFTTPPPSHQRSPHADWYASMLPAMIPIALLGSAVYMGLQLVQGRLAHEKYLDDANARIHALEQEVDALHKGRASALAASAPPSPSSSRWWRWS